MSVSSIKDNIQEHGWQFQYVFDAKGEKENFAYSIGFEETFGHPEIMIFGLKQETMHTILANLATEIRSGRHFEENIKTSNVLSGDFEVLFKNIKQEFLPQYAGIATEYYGRPFRLMIMFWPDKFNSLPTDEACTITIQNEALDLI